MQKVVYPMTHLTPIEYKIIYCIQRLDDIIVAALPWLKWLTVVCLTVCVTALACWDIKRTL